MTNTPMSSKVEGASLCRDKTIDQFDVVAVEED
jgi:hypothetical protein